MTHDLRWLDWARTIQAIAQNGLTYTESAYDRERYEQLRDLAVDIFAQHTTAPPPEIRRWFELQPGYMTPKVDVRGACFRDGQVLMVRERSDGGWCLPGGWADVGDTPAESAAREVLEEAGFVCVPRKVIGVFDANRNGAPLAAFHAVKIVFHCDIVSGEPHGNHETDGVAFFQRDEIPALSAARTSPGQLAECFAHYDAPERSTHFD